MDLDWQLDWQPNYDDDDANAKKKYQSINKKQKTWKHKIVTA